ncbi:MAG: hypothetical protein AB4041_17930 [Microcystaceae cyanobacterium]
MLTLKLAKASVVALLLGTSTLTSLSPVVAQPYSIYADDRNDYNYQAGVVEAGTRIPISYDEDTLTLEQGQTIPLTLTVASPIRDRNGRVVIPAGSTIEGQLEPSGQQVRYVAREIKIDSDTPLTFDAASDVVGQVETVDIQANTVDILKGTVAGAGAATILAGTTGDRRINALEVLGGAAFGTLAGWALPTAGVIGGGTKEVITLNPNRDLTLVLQSDLSTGDSLDDSYQTIPNRYPTSRPFPSQPRRRSNGRFW